MEGDKPRRDRSAEIIVGIDSCLEEQDVVLAALREQLKGKVIDFELYQERRAVYLQNRFPQPPDDAA